MDLKGVVGYGVGAGVKAGKAVADAVKNHPKAAAAVGAGAIGASLVAGKAVDFAKEHPRAVIGATTGVVGLTIADMLAGKTEKDRTRAKVTTAVATTAAVGGAALLFLTGKANGATNKEALKKGFEIAKSGAKTVIEQFKATNAGKKVADVAGKVFSKAKTVASAAKDKISGLVDIIKNKIAKPEITDIVIQDVKDFVG